MRPFYINCSKGRIFLNLYEPHDSKTKNSAVIVIPPFAEELNKSKKMLSDLGESVSRENITVMFVDLFGTGDSHGEFEDATWDIWLENLETVYRWLIENGYKSIQILAVRLGTLLALEAISSNKIKCESLVLWQPVFDGYKYINQFLRLKVANEAFESGNKISTADLRHEATNELYVEIAGYRLSGKLIEQIDTRLAKNYIQNIDCKIFVIEVAEDSKKNSIATRKFFSNCEKNKILIDLITCEGEKFWSSYEIVSIENVIDQTIKAFAK